MFENIGSFFRRMVKPEQKELGSKDAAKERLHLVLMQDRANVSSEFLELMKQEILDVIKKYIIVDESQIDVRLTNQQNEDGTNGAPSLYANIPIVNIKNEMLVGKVKEFDSKTNSINFGEYKMVIETVSNADAEVENEIQTESSAEEEVKQEEVVEEVVEKEAEEVKEENIENSESVEENTEVIEVVEEEEDYDDDDDVTVDDLLKKAEEEDKLLAEKEGSDLKAKIEEKVQEIKEEAGELFEEVKEEVKEITENVKDGIKDIKEKVSTQKNNYTKSNKPKRKGKK